MKIIEGDLIKLALEGNFDCICHGCNCQNRQASGIAKQMNETFLTGYSELYYLESDNFKGDRHKLGKIEYVEWYSNDINLKNKNWDLFDNYMNNSLIIQRLIVINCYTQFYYGRDKFTTYLDYQALESCMLEINKTFQGKVIGIPYLIGCGLAGGNEEHVLEILERTLIDMEVILVKLKK